jgi:predicted nucleotidyltransferase
MVIELEKELEDVHLAKKTKKEEKPLGPPQEIFEKVVKFTNEARKHYGNIIKSVLIFGSAAKGTMVKGSDADLWIVLDDTMTKGSEDLEKVNSQLYLIAHELKDLHIQTTTLTEFWDWIKRGSPELVNYLRYGLVVYDTGFVKPVQRMLQLGLIPPSEETITLKARAAEARYKKIKLDIMGMIFELRYTAMDIIQAAIMYFYKATPDYKAAPEYLEKMVKDKKLEKLYVEKFKELDGLWRSIDHKEIKEVTTEHLEKALVLSKEIIVRFKKLLPKNIIGEELPELEG